MSFRFHYIPYLTNRIKNLHKELNRDFTELIFFKPEVAENQLNFRCFPVHNLSPSLEVSIKNLIQVAASHGSQSLSMNQILQTRSRIFIMAKKIDSKKWLNRDLAFDDFRICINPKILESSDNLYHNWEYCPSFPNIRNFVGRPEQITISFLNKNFEVEIDELKGAEAAVFQHEIDHLDGKHFMNRDLDPKLDQILDLDIISAEMQNSFFEIDEEANKLLENYENPSSELIAKYRIEIAHKKIKLVKDNFQNPLTERTGNSRLEQQFGKQELDPNIMLL